MYKHCISKNAISVFQNSQLAVDKNGQLVAINLTNNYRYTFAVDGLSDREEIIKPFQFTPYGLCHYIKNLRKESQPTNTDTGRENTPLKKDTTSSFDELSESELEVIEHKEFIDQLDDEMWGCLGYIALAGIIIYILIKFFV